jgi:hypothetical protein
MAIEIFKARRMSRIAVGRGIIMTIRIPTIPMEIPTSMLANNEVPLACALAASMVGSLYLIVA